jgi:hypothetical protein
MDQALLFACMGGGVLVPSLVFPANIAAIDMDHVNQQYYGGALPDNSNTDDGRLLRQMIVSAQPNFLEQANGSLKTYSVTSAIRRSNLFGSFIGLGMTNTDLQSRSFNNASWTAVGCTVAKDATGRTGVANSCCTVTLTATTATLTLAASTDVTARSRLAALEAKQTVGSGGALAISMDNAATFPSLVVTAIAGAGALGFSKYRSAAVQTALASPQKQIQITGTIGDKWVLDHSETLWTSFTDAELLAIEQPPIPTTTTGLQVWSDRPTAAITGYSGWTTTSPLATFFQGATQAHYYEWWQRRDGGLIASAGGVQITSNQTNGVTGMGLQSFNAGAGKKPIYTTNPRAPIKNKMMVGQSAGESFIILNDGALITGAGGSLANVSDHDDEGTNGAANLSLGGGIFRHVASTDYANMKALALAGATL